MVGRDALGTPGIYADVGLKSTARRGRRALQAHIFALFNTYDAGIAIPMRG